MNYTIEFVDKISDIEEDKMTKDLIAYESVHEIDVNYKKFWVVLKDSNGIVFGALNAFTAFAEIYVGDIWVDTAHRGKGFGNDWIYPELVDTLHQLKVCPATRRNLTPTKYILFDATLGYCHQATGKYIDFLICLDTPLDIALARRLIRNHQGNPTPQKMIQEFEEYLSKSRPLFILPPEEKTSDLLVDGSLPLQEQEKQVLNALSLFEEKISDKNE